MDDCDSYIDGEQLVNEGIGKKSSIFLMQGKRVAEISFRRHFPNTKKPSFFK